MKRILTILLLGISILAHTTNYYVATDGSDGAAGTIGAPWATWDYGLSNIGAGDSLIIRGGTYLNTSSASNLVGLVGTANDPIVIMAYPGEVPKLDGINRSSPGQGFVLYNSSYVVIKGLHITRQFQINTDYLDARGMQFYNCGNIYLYDIKISYIGRRGLECNNVDSIWVYNSDFHNCADSLSSTPYNGGDGAIIFDTPNNDTLDYAYFYGCRFHSNSDDGNDFESEGVIEMVNCWSFLNGWYDGALEGNGFKLQLTPETQKQEPNRIYRNCLAAFNRQIGFSTNDNNSPIAQPIQLINCTSASNGTGYHIYSTNDTQGDEEKREIYNSIAYDNTTNVVEAGFYTESNNSWSAGAPTMTVADFVLIDSATAVNQMLASRGSDGSLPNLTFMNLAEGSDLIDAGIDKGYSYTGVAPDLGYAEYITQINPSPPPDTAIPISIGGFASGYWITDNMISRNPNISTPVDTTQFDEVVDKVLFGPLYYDEFNNTVDSHFPEDSLDKYVVAAGAMHLDSIYARANSWWDARATKQQQPNIATKQVRLRSGGTLATKMLRTSQPEETRHDYYTPMNYWFKYATTTLYPASDLYDQWFSYLILIENNAGNSSMEGTDEVKLGKLSMSPDIDVQTPSSDSVNYDVNNIGILMKGNTPTGSFRGTSYSTGGFFFGYPGGQLTSPTDTTEVVDFALSDTARLVQVRVITRLDGTSQYGAIQLFWDGWLGWTWIEYPDDYLDANKRGDPLKIATQDSVSNTVKLQNWWGGNDPDDRPHNGDGTLHTVGETVYTLDKTLEFSRWCKLWPRHVRAPIPDHIKTIMGE
jgi:hypothetical protein